MTDEAYKILIVDAYVSKPIDFKVMRESLKKTGVVR